MEEAVQTFTLPPRRREAGLEERQALLDRLAATRVQINQAYLCFNSTADPDLIESYVYEINSLQARYNYLLRRAKELGEPL